MDNLLVIISAALAIGFIIWWFFGKRDQGRVEASLLSDNSQQVRVTVDGGYTPNIVILNKGVPADIVFERKDPSGCFNEVVFPDFGIHEVLPVGQPHSIKIDTSQAGEYEYACGMNMFHGKVVIQ